MTSVQCLQNRRGQAMFSPDLCMHEFYAERCIQNAMGATPSDEICFAKMSP